MRRQLIFLVTAVVAAGVALLGGALARSGSEGMELPPRPEAAGRLLAGFSAGDTAAFVRQLERQMAADAGNAEALTLLGLAYQQRARETGDPSFYPRAEEALERALQLGQDSDLALTGLAALAASRHRFEDARVFAERALRLNPGRAAIHGILGDALVELGRYEHAFTAFERMVSLKPSASSYARVSYARELLGRPRAAVAAMQLAVRAASANAENAAWALVQLGNLHFEAGRLQSAARAYREALARFPGYAQAQAALARTEAARGRTEPAVDLYQYALERMPLPEYAAGLADVLTSAGRHAEAREAYELLAVLERLLAANGVRTDLEAALVDLDRGHDLPGALARAREVYEERRSVEAEDVLAWALYRNGRCEEARRHSRLALRLGTRSALMLFHRGMIELCHGNDRAGRRHVTEALALNPHFSLRWAPVARRLVR